MVPAAKSLLGARERRARETVRDGMVSATKSLLQASDEVWRLLEVPGMEQVIFGLRPTIDSSFGFAIVLRKKFGNGFGPTDQFWPWPAIDSSFGFAIVL